MNTTNETLSLFLEKRRVKEKNKPFNMVGMDGKLKGKFYILDEERQYFYDLYVHDVFQEHHHYALIECHKPFGPFVCDIDLRYKKSDDYAMDRHLYTSKFIQDFLIRFMTLIETYVKLDHINEREAFVLEKPKPTVKEDGETIKDGIHIIFPYIVTDPDIQYIIREELIESTREMFDQYPIPLENSMEDIIDESVIYKNGWMMYGCQKPDSEMYKLTGIWMVDKYQARCLTMQEKKELYFNNRRLVELMSIQRVNVGDLCELNEYGKSYVEYWKKENIKTLKSKDKNTKHIYCEDIEFAKKLVDLLHPHRAERYQTWIEVGWCLFNIDYRLKEKWIEFSEKSDKYKKTARQDCDLQWDKIEADGLSYGTLHMWAKMDSPFFYQQIIRQSLEYEIRLCCYILTKTGSSNLKSTEDGADGDKGGGSGGGGGKHNTGNNGSGGGGGGGTKRICWEDAAYYIVKVIKKMYYHHFVCSSYSSKIWWEFKHHHWVLSDKGVSLRQNITSEVYTIFRNVSMKYYDLLNKLHTDDSITRDRYMKLALNCHNIAEKVRNIKFRSTLLEEAAEQFYWNSDESEMHEKNFEEILDSNLYLIGLRNGVYDLRIFSIRPGRCEDYVSMTTNNEYIEYTWNHRMIKDIMLFIEQVLPKDRVRHYVLTTLGSFLDGSTGNEKFHIWVGSGGNGKSKLIELFQLAMGEYCGSLPVTVITQQRPASNAASPELARLKGKRFVSIQEPNEKEKLQVGRMKELTGGDTIYARGLHKEPIEYKPQFKMILACNHLPRVPPDDGGSWRRIRVVKFNSKFVENPDPDDENQFKADPLLHKKLVEWKEGFFWILTQYYRFFKMGDSSRDISPGVHEPPEVTEVTDQYRNRNDIISDFMKDSVMLEEKGFTTLTELYARYLQWCRNSNYSAVQRNDFQESIETRIGSINNSRKGWKGICIKLEDDIEEEEQHENT